MDSVEKALLTTIDQYVKDAKLLLKNKQIIEASLKIQEIFDNVLEDFDLQVSQATNLVGYQIQISPMLRSGLSDYIMNTPGNVKMRNVTAEENLKRSNYRIADNIDYLDGDLKSSVDNPGDAASAVAIAEYNTGKKNEDFAMYRRGKEGALKKAGEPTSLISDKSRVYKGASWKDRAYYINPGTRRFLEQDRSTSTIGFRCAMDRIGSPTGMGVFK
tara:strand:- start:48 stop:695 length:648 start_codon:yes stop_codon:yes gene_type:complete